EERLDPRHEIDAAAHLPGVEVALQPHALRHLELPAGADLPALPVQVGVALRGMDAEALEPDAAAGDDDVDAQAGAHLPDDVRRSLRVVGGVDDVALAVPGDVHRAG